jgi:adenosylcobinamide kinase / adenosylcobinamide-phosphate guanylyltransferase
LALLNAENRMHPDSTREITLVLGGVRSGKSCYALRLATRAQRVTFLATAERREDAEMHRKIERHRAERPQHWTTVEEPLNLAAAIGSVSNCDLLLIDCLTLFAGKLLEVHGENLSALAANVDALCAALRGSSCSIVLVSNEVGSGIVPAFELGRRYRDLLGEINQRVAVIADHVVLMVAGLPLTLKGSLNREVRA